MNPVNNSNKYIINPSHQQPNIESANKPNEWVEKATTTSFPAQTPTEPFSHQAVNQSHLQRQIQSLLSSTKFQEIEQDAIKLIRKIISSNLSEPQRDEIYEEAKALEKKLDREQHPDAIHLIRLMQKIYTYNAQTFLNDNCVFSSLFINIIQTVMIDNCKIKLLAVKNKDGYIPEQKLTKGLKFLTNLLAKRIHFSEYEINLIFDNTEMRTFTVGLDTSTGYHTIELKKTSLKFLHNLHDFLKNEDTFEEFINEEIKFTFFLERFNFRKKKSNNRASNDCVSRSCLTGLYLLLFSYNNLNIISKIPNHILLKYRNQINALVSITKSDKSHKLAPLKSLLTKKGVRAQKYEARGILDLNSSLHCRESPWSGRPFAFKSENDINELKHSYSTRDVPSSNCIRKIGDLDFDNKFKISKLYKQLRETLSKSKEGDDVCLTVKDLLLQFDDNPTCQVTLDREELEGKLHKTFYIHTLTLFLLLCQEKKNPLFFSNRIIYTYLVMLKQELENSRQKFTFAEWLIMPFEAMFYDSRTKTGSLDMETYSWIKMIETLAKNVETTPYTDETNEYDSLVLKMFIEKETGIRIVLHPGEESLEEILPSGAIESLQQDFMDELSDHTNQGPETAILPLPAALGERSLPENTLNPSESLFSAPSDPSGIADVQESNEPLAIDPKSPNSGDEPLILFQDPLILFQDNVEEARSYRNVTKVADESDTSDEEENDFMQTSISESVEAAVTEPENTVATNFHDAAVESPPLESISVTPGSSSSLALPQVSLPENFEKVPIPRSISNQISNGLAEELNRALTSQLFLNPPSLSLVIPAANNPVQTKKSALKKRTYENLEKTSGNHTVQLTTQVQRKHVSFGIEESHPTREKPAVKKARVIYLEEPNASASSRIARIKSSTQHIEPIRPVQKHVVDLQIYYKALPYPTPLNYPIIHQLQGTSEATGTPFFHHDRDRLIHKIHQARNNKIGTIVTGLAPFDKIPIYGDFFRTSISEGPGSHLLIMSEISDSVCKQLDTDLSVVPNQKEKQLQNDKKPTITPCKTESDFIAAFKEEKQDLLILTTYDAIQVVDRSLLNHFGFRSIIVDDAQTTEHNKVNQSIRELIRNQQKKAEEANQTAPAVLFTTKTLYADHISELYTQHALINHDKFTATTKKALDEILSDTLLKLMDGKHKESKQLKAQIQNAFGHFYHFKQILAHSTFIIKKDDNTIPSIFDTFFQEKIKEERMAWEKFLCDDSAELTNSFVLWCDVLMHSAYRICYKNKTPKSADDLATALKSYFSTLKNATSTAILHEQIQQLSPHAFSTVKATSTEPAITPMPVDCSTTINKVSEAAKDAEFSEKELIVIPLPKESTREFTEKLGAMLLSEAHNQTIKTLVNQICRILDTKDGPRLRRAVREGRIEDMARIPIEVRAQKLDILLKKLYDNMQKSQIKEIPYSVSVYKYERPSKPHEVGKFCLVDSQKNARARHTIRLYASRNAAPGDAHYDLLVRRSNSQSPENKSNSYSS
jgi:hypothetical protein